MPSLWTSSETDFSWESSVGSDSASSPIEELDPTDLAPAAAWSKSHAAGDAPNSTLSIRSWPQPTCKVQPASPPAANITPPEILLQIFTMLTPRDFDNARRTCSQWMRVSLNEHLLENMLKRAGWWDAWQRDCQMRRPSVSEYKDHSLVWRMSRRFATECILSGRKMNVERQGFLTTTVVDFSRLSKAQLSPRSRRPSSHPDFSTKIPAAVVTPKFNVSNCGNYLLVTSGSTIYVYHLLTRKPGNSIPVCLDGANHVDITPVASIPCPVEVLTATIDTSTSRLVVAALLRDRVGMVCDLVDSGEIVTPSRTGSDAPGFTYHKMHWLEPTSRHYFINVCSTVDPPRSVSICPGRRCVAFGCGGGIELHWVDEKTKRDFRKHFDMSQPSEVLHFLPTRPETPMELRLISSLAGPGMPGCQCHNPSSVENRPTCRFHFLAGVHSLTRWTPGESGNSSLVRATHCHHYRAVPINDGLHILFIEPRTGLLCIGSDSPIGGPTSLTQALICVPPFGKDVSDNSKEALMPTVFAAGADLNWGLRVVAVYRNRIVLYSVPLDVFNVIRKERERQGDGVMGDSDLARDWFLDGERSSGKRRESLIPNQNGDWEFLLSVSYRPTAMMWPFKIYGKEIGRMENVVELALQSSYGGARVWAFGASGETNVIDVDTFTSTAQRATDIPCKSLTVDADGSVTSARLVNRAEPSLLSPQSSRKRKLPEQCEDFSGQHSTARQLGVFDPPFLAKSGVQPADVSARRRPSFAACIVDFKIPELGAREGRWVESGSA